jgi:Zn finger protein HypA/HybF involved in hydrogenase expression
MKPYVYNCWDCDLEWESDNGKEHFCPECHSEHIEMEEVHAD